VFPQTKKIASIPTDRQKYRAFSQTDKKPCIPTEKA
jgi:hypothetical protein